MVFIRGRSVANTCYPPRCHRRREKMAVEASARPELRRLIHARRLCRLRVMLSEEFCRRDAMHAQWVHGFVQIQPSLDAGRELRNEIGSAGS